MPITTRRRMIPVLVLGFAQAAAGSPQTPEPEKASLAAVEFAIIPVLLYQDGNRCKPIYPEEAEATSGGFVAWKIRNECSNQKHFKLEKFKKGDVLESPLNRGCVLEQRPGKDEVVWIICRVTKDVGGSPVTYKYSLKGDFNVDPMLVVRPPQSLLCARCAKECAGCK